MKARSKAPATKKAKAGDTEAPVRLFKDQSAWSAWLDKNHSGSTGIWLRLAKKIQD
jgi:uncharacterized protein YdeI (YjbR/CyaY-like superfamily)